MKIISWNVNGIRSINGQNPSKKFDKITKENKLFDFINRENPDIICIQETKADLEQLNEDLKYPPGYYGFYHSSRSKKGYSGVVTYSKIQPKSHNISIGIEKFDIEGRIVETEFDEFILLNVYFPNGTSGMHRVDYKLEFYDALFNYLEPHRKSGKRLIICGDYNTAHHEIDLARPKENIDTSGFMPIEREKLDKIVGLGYVDTFRQFNNEPNHYTWWSNRARARENNVGWRIDYHFVTENLMPLVTNSYHLPSEEGSDHCPIVLEIN
ncbi:MAG: exodeoxyribonuclease III [Candidatus Kapabacteria bacterium]|nr:exodeoxyribonuclease III [Ignavibacteriota bacterium]MCW5883626.1 exodeoxyribonuclease III [Candidatus Kapabacteria bacterium]